MCIQERVGFLCFSCKRSMFSGYEIHFKGLEMFTINWKLAWVVLIISTLWLLLFKSYNSFVLWCFNTDILGEKWSFKTLKSVIFLAYLLWLHFNCYKSVHTKCSFDWVFMGFTCILSLLAGYSVSDFTAVLFGPPGSLLVPHPLTRGRSSLNFCGCWGLYGVVASWCLLCGL